MSKRVHELAKELDKTNKEILAFLSEKSIEVKSHMSVLTDEQEGMVKKAFTLKSTAPEKEAPAEKPVEKPAAPPQKKKKIIAVYNTHNSQTGIKDPRGERRQKQERPAQGRPVAPAGGRPAASGQRPAAPAGSRPVAPGQRPAAAAGSRPVTREQGKPAAAGSRPVATV